MDTQAIQRVTEAIRHRLEHAIGPNNIVFVGPLHDTDAEDAQLVLFLYRVVPNADLRNTPHVVPAANPNDPPKIHENALPLDLYFLITVGATPAPGEEPLLRALGYAIQALQLDPNLVGAPVGQETVHVTLEPLSTEEASRIWALFPTANYRTSVAYVASPVWIDPPQPDPEAVPVITDTLVAGSLEVTQ